jgi:hypothetical protein
MEMLDSDILSSIFNGLNGENKPEILTSCRLARENVAAMSPGDIRNVTDALVSLFYLDNIKDDEYAEIVECATEAIASMGPGTVPVLIEGLTGADLHANLLIAETLGKIGTPAVAMLKNIFRTDPDPYQRSVALLALSGIDDPALIDIFPDVVSAMDHENGELRSTAVQAIGRMVDCIGGVCLAPDVANSAFEKLVAKISDPHAGTRARAITAIGKLGAKDYLDDGRKTQAIDITGSLLGLDNKHEWDRAFIVRKAAENAYHALTGKRANTRGACEYCGEEN